MNRSRFTKSLVFGGLGLFGCSGQSREDNPGAKTNRGNLKYYRLPSKDGAELITSILPNKVFRSLEKPSPIVHPDKIPSTGHEGEDRREWYARYRAEIAEHARKLSEAESYFESLKLHPLHYDLLKRLSDIQRQHKSRVLNIVYDVTGSPGHVTSLDLTGVRINLSKMSFSDPDDRPPEEPKPRVTSESFDELMNIRTIKRLFLNYADAPFDRFLQLIRQYDAFEALGLPNGIDPDQLEQVMAGRHLDVLDLSGQEYSNYRSQLVEVAIRGDVSWLVFSGVDFHSSWLKVDWTLASSAFRGMIKRRSIGVFDYEPAMNQEAQSGPRE